MKKQRSLPKAAYWKQPQIILKQAKKRIGLFEKTFDKNDTFLVTSVEVTGDCQGDLNSHVQLTDEYDIIDMVHAEWDLLSVPERCTFDEDVKNPVITFLFEKETFNEISQKNLMCVIYDGELDAEKCGFSISVYKPGIIYMLVYDDKWKAAPDSNYSYTLDQLDFSTVWEQSGDTGSICEIADKEWAVENSPDYHVKTVEQLAVIVCLERRQTVEYNRFQ